MNWTIEQISIEQELRGRGFTGQVGLLVCTLDGHVIYGHAQERVFPAASTIKVPLLIMALQQAQAGTLDLNGRVVMQAADRVPGAGVLHELTGGLALMWRDVLTLMIIVSDNTATNLVIERLGLESFNHWLKEHDLRETHLVGKLQLPEHLRNEAQRRGERNQTSARDQVALLLGLVNGQWLDETHTQLALNILMRQLLRDILGRRVPRDEKGELLFPVASKSGELSGVHHDVGIVYLPRPLVVALLSEGGLDPREHPENREVTLLADVLWPLLAQAGRLREDNTGDI